MKRLVTALLLLVATSVSSFAQQVFPVPSGWENQRTSIMKIYTIDPSGNFTGVYFNNAAGFQCQYGPNNPVPYTVNGHASGNSVIFNVSGTTAFKTAILGPFGLERCRAGR